MLIDLRPHLQLDKRNNILVETAITLNYFTSDPDVHVSALDACIAKLSKENLDDLINPDFAYQPHQIAWWYFTYMKKILESEQKTISYLLEECHEYQHLQGFFGQLEDIVSNVRLEVLFGGIESDFDEILANSSTEYFIQLLINFDALGYHLSRVHIKRIMDELNPDHSFFKTLTYCSYLRRSLHLLKPNDIKPNYQLCMNTLESYFAMNNDLG